MRRAPLLLLAVALGATSARAQETVLVAAGSPVTYLANATNPGLGTAWVSAEFDNSAWAAGAYGVGYETAPPGAQNLIATSVPAGVFSVYTRAEFSIVDPAAVATLALGADYDDGYVAWLNGVEVYRSPEIPSGAISWNTNAALHESSNGAAPDYGVLRDVTTAGLPALRAGTNVLAVGVWNSGAPSSSDLVLVPYLAMNLPLTVTRGPYLQGGTPTSTVVRWRTSLTSAGRVRFGPAPEDLSAFADDPNITTNHAVLLSGLQPGTTYFYSVGTSAGTLAGGDAGHFFVTSPPAGSATPARVWVVGDSGTADTNAQAVRDAYMNLTGGGHTDLWLMLGDNAYPNGTDSEYQAAVFDLYPEMLRTTVLWPTLGNHDGVSADSATESGPYYDIFTLPRQAEAGGLPSGTEAYYSFDYGNIHFICLDSFESDRSPGGAMLTWLQADVMATSREWVIAFWHHPPYSKGSHNSDTEIELVEMRTNVLPILESAGVDLVLSGHSHSYERTHLLDGHYGLSGTLTPGMVLDGGDGRIDGSGAYHKPPGPPSAAGGAVYVVAGSSGQTSGGPLNHPAMFLALNILGSLVLEVDGPELSARFLDGAGAWRDYFTLYKGTGTPPVADFTGQPRRGPAPHLVSFSDISSNGAAARAWDFENDGATDSGAPAPPHAYAQPGFRTVRLTAFSAPGSDEEIKPDYICVASPEATADTDGDGLADPVDPCPCAALSPGIVGDTVQVAAAPQPGGGGDSITWVRDSTGALSNVYRGTIQPGAPFSYDHACLVPSTPGESASVPDAPAIGAAFYYLVSAGNGCGEGGLGSDWAGVPRPNPAPCP